MPNSWDTRCWLIGVIVPLVGLALGIVAKSQPADAFLTAHLCPHGLCTEDPGNDVFALLAFSVMFFLPGVLTVLGRRRAFLWGALPLVVEAVSNSGYEVYLGRWDLLHWRPVTFLAYAVIWWMSSGIGLLIRGLLKNRTAKRLAKEQSRVVQSGLQDTDKIWPPPPRSDAS